MVAYLREVVDVSALVLGAEYDKDLFNQTVETLNFQKYVVGQTIEWVGEIDGVLDEISYPYLLIAPSNCLLTPTMLENTYTALETTDFDVIKTKCNIEHPDYYLGHCLVRVSSLYEQANPTVTTLDIVGAICDA